MNETVQVPDTTPATSARVERPYLLERIGEAAVVQYYADGFDALPAATKILAWHLYEAAWPAATSITTSGTGTNWPCAARSTPWSATPRRCRRQAGPPSCATPSGSDPHRPYHSLTARKFVTTCRARPSPERPGRGRRRGRFRCARASPSTTDSTAGAGALRRRRRAMVTSKTPRTVRTSSPPRQQSLRRREPRRPRRIHRALRTERPPRQDDGRPGAKEVIAWGRYDAAIRRIVGHMEDAIPWRRPPWLAALHAWCASTSAASRSSPAPTTSLGRGIASRRSTPSTGFLEVYLDARGARAVGSRRLLRQVDRPAVPGDRRRRAVVRGPDAVGPGIPQAAGPGGVGPAIDVVVEAV